MRIEQGQAYPLGSVWDGEGTNFSVYSSIAERVELCVFDGDGVERRVELPGRSGPLWHGYVIGVAPGRHYGYRVYGPWAPSAGHLCTPDKLLIDPYARALTGTVRWNDALFPYDATRPEHPVNDTDSAPLVPRSVVTNDAFDWSDDRRPGVPLSETVIYEAHVKGMSKLHPVVPPELRGTYAGLAAPAVTEHLQRLGVTAVELLPVQAFVHRRHLVARGQRNYWGYDPINYFSPHPEYAASGDPLEVVREFKEMVRGLHAAGIEVILDVVFNHTGEGGEDGPILSFRGFDNATYYRLSGGERLTYIDVTGTQNTFNAAHPQVRRLILDSLVYWAHDMHVDGFRFDLAPALLREGDHVNMHGALFNAIRAEPVLAGVKLIAEPWDLGDAGYRLGEFPVGWSEWNDRYRDDVRSYWNGRQGSNIALMHRVSGSRDIFGGVERPTEASINFVTCHDGFTLADLNSYEQKRNEANGEDNRDGPSDNVSWNCGVEGETDDPEVLALRARQRRNLIATLLISRGVPMLLAGDELGRTQRGNNNAYCQDNEVSWLDWKRGDADLMAFVERVAWLRQEHPAARGETGTPEWFDPVGAPVSEDGLQDAPVPLQVLFGRERRGLLLMMNPTREPVVFTPPSISRGATFHVLLDTESGSDQAAGRLGNSHKVAPHAMVVAGLR